MHHYGAIEEKLTTRRSHNGHLLDRNTREGTWTPTARVAESHGRESRRRACLFHRQPGAGRTVRA
jgi:hypothetical protein